MSNRTDRTHIEGLKDPIEVGPPSSYSFPVVLRTDKSGELILSILLNNLLPDLCHGSVVKNVVGELSKSCTSDLTHIVNCEIASRTD